MGEKRKEGEDEDEDEDGGGGRLKEKGGSDLEFP